MQTDARVLTLLQQTVGVIHDHLPNRVNYETMARKGIRPMDDDFYADLKVAVRGPFESLEKLQRTLNA